MAHLHLDLGVVFRQVGLYRNQYEWILGVDFEDAKRQARDLWLLLKLTIPMDNLSTRSSSQECQFYTFWTFRVRNRLYICCSKAKYHTIHW